MASVDRSLIAGLPLFRDFSPAALDEVLSEARPVRYAKNTGIFGQDEEAHSFYLLLHGRVRAYRLTTSGEQVVIRFVGPGELFGIASAIGRSTYPAHANAVVDSVVLVWPTTAWPSLVARYPQLALNTMQALGTRLQESQTRLTEMATQEVERRVAHTLLRLANQSGQQTSDGITIGFPISRQDIAEMTGTTLHTVSRILSAWEDQQIIASGRRKVTIRDPHRLYALAESHAE